MFGEQAQTKTLRRSTESVMYIFGWVQNKNIGGIVSGKCGMTCLFLEGALS